MSLNPKEAGRVIEKFILGKCKVPINLIGGRGIGKSQIVADTAKKLGYFCIDIRLALDTAEDLAGWPRPTEDSVKYLINDWMKLAEEKAKTYEGIVVFFDEINRAPLEVRQALFELMSKYTMRRYPLPQNSYIIFAMNPDNGNYQVEPLDPAFLRRMVNIPLSPDLKSWQDWAEKNENELVHGFIMDNPKYLFVEEEVKVESLPNPDAWRMVGDILSKVELTDREMLNVFTGIVGKEATSLFIKHLKSELHPMTAKEVMEWEWETVQNRLHEYIEKKDNASAVTSGDNVADYLNKKIQKLTNEEIERFCFFILEFSPEIGVGVLNKLVPEIVDVLIKYKKNNEKLIKQLTDKYYREEKAELEVTKEAEKKV
mgnify:CR=1 FL=1